MTMQTDNPLVRASDLCPLCDGLKPIGNVACWTCYKAAQMKYGNPVAEALISAREAALQEEQAAQA